MNRAQGAASLGLPASILAVALVLAAVPALSADGGAYGGIVPAAYADSPDACPATDASDCTFHVTDSMYMPEVLGRFISEGPDGRLYVATVPHYSFQDHESTVRVYDTDRSHIQTVTLENANITAMGINHEERELHLVKATDQEHHHSELGPRTHQIATSSLISYNIAADGTLTEVDTVQLMHTYGNDTDAAIDVPKLDVRDIAIDHLNDRVYVAGVWGEAGNNTDDAWKGFAPVMVVNTADTNHSMYQISFNGTTGWNPFNHSVAATAIVLDVTSTSNIAYVAARQHNESHADYGVYALNFSSDDAGAFTHEYTAMGGYDTYPGNSIDPAIPDIQSYVQAVDMVKHGDALFAYFVNGSLARIALDGSIPVNSTLIGDKGYGDTTNLFGAGAIAVDGERGLLYALSNVWHVPELRVLNASNPDVPLISASSIGAETSHSDAAVGADGTVYLSRDWVPHILVVDPHARTDLQKMLDDADAYEAVTIPGGTYHDTILTVDKPLAVESENAVFTGNSRLEIIADNVTVSGLSFEGMCLPGYSGGAVSIHNGRTAAGTVPANGGIGNAQRQNVTISGISVSDTCNAGIQLVGKDGLADSNIRDNAFTNIGLKIHRDHDGPADIVAVDEYSAMHGAIAMAYHPTAQQPVTGTAITDNAIDGSSAAGIRVTRPDGVTITGNTIRDTADSAIGLAAASKNTVIADNTITNANNETDFDYMDHVEGSNGTAHYQRAVPLVGPETNKWWAEYAQYDGDPYASEAAIKVWTSGSGGDTTGITVRNNSIAGGNGGFLACAGLCAVETDGAIHSGSRNIRPNTTDVTSAFTISGNTISADVMGAPFANGASGIINVTGGAVLATGENRGGILPVGVTMLGVTSVATPEGPHGIGDFTITVEFNKAVNVTGGPVLRFADGRATAPAAAVASTASIAFTYTVLEGAPDQADLVPEAIVGGTIVSATDGSLDATRTLPPDVDPITIDSVRPYMASAPEIENSALTLRLDAPANVADMSKIAVAGITLSPGDDAVPEGNTVTITLPADAAAAAAASERQPSVRLMPGALADAADNENLGHDLRVGACDVDSKSCTFHVTDSMYMPEVLGSIISEDRTTGRLYVATVPHYSFQGNDSTIRIYDADRASVPETVVHEDTKIVAMGINHVTRELHVVAATDLESHPAALSTDHYGNPNHHLPPIASASLVSYSMDDADGTLEPVDTVSLAHTYKDGNNTVQVSKIDVRDIAVDHLNDRVYVAGIWGDADPSHAPADDWKGYAPVVVVDTAGTDHAMHELQFDPADNAAWNPFRHSVAASAIEIDAASNTAYVVARQHGGTGYNQGVYKLNFSSNAAGDFTQNYTLAGGVDIRIEDSDETIIRFEPAAVQAIDMAKYDQNLFVTFGNGTMYRFALDGNGIPEGQPVKMAEGWSDDDWSMYFAEGTRALAVDENRGLLYALSNIWHTPELRVFDAAQDGVPLISASGIGAEVTRSALEVSSRAGGTAYLTRDWVPHVMVVEPQAPTDLQGMIDDAPDYSTVVIPDGIYRDTILTIDKPLTIKSESDDAAFVGNSRLEIIADNVTVRDLSFEGMCLPGYPYGAVSILNGRTAAGAAAPAIDDIGEPRENVTISGISVSDTCNAGVQLVGENGLAGSVVSGNTFTNIGLKAARDHSGPADIVAVDEYGAMHGAIGLSFHPTGQAAVTDTMITGNDIDGSSAAGIRVMKPDGVTISDNRISNTADSAIGLAAAATSTTISNNTISNANNETDFDYLDHIENSDSPSHYYKSWDDPGPRDDTVWWRLSPQPYNGTPAADAAIKVWADAGTADITIRDNNIAGGNGGFVACAGVCGVETDGFIQHGDRDIVNASNDVSAVFNVTGNTIFDTVAGAPYANDASGNITVMGGAVLATGNNTGGIILDMVSMVGVDAVSTTPPATPGEPHGIDDTVSITVTFSEPVTVSGAPVLRFDDGGVAPFVSAGADSITFTYTVLEGAPGQADLATATIVGGSIVSVSNPSSAASRALPPNVDPIHIDSVRPYMASAPEINGGNLALRLDAPAAVADISKIAVAGITLSPGDDAVPEGNTVTITLPAGAAAAAEASERQPSVRLMPGALADAAGNENLGHDLRVGACDVDSKSCTFHVTDSMYLPEVLGSIIREDTATGRLYVATVPHYSFQGNVSTIRIYDADRASVPAETVVLEDTKIVAMGINHVTRELHVVAATDLEGHPAAISADHYGNPNHHLPPIASARLVSYSMDDADGALDMVDTVSLARTYKDGSNTVQVPKIDVRDIAVDHVNDRVYVAGIWGDADPSHDPADDWKGYAPVMVVDTGASHSVYPTQFDPAANAGWNPFRHSVAASAIEIDAASNTAYVVARQHDGTGHNQGVYKLNFSSNAAGDFTQNYTLAGGVDIRIDDADETIIRFEPAAVQAIDMAKYDQNLFVTFGNGTMYRFALDGNGIPEGQPVKMAEGWSDDDWSMYFAEGTRALAVDENRGLLYALSNIWHTPELRVFDAAQDGVPLISASGIGAEVTRSALEVSSRAGGTAYLTRDWVPHVMVVEPQAPSDLQQMLDDAAEHETVVIPDGNYRDTILTVDKPLTVIKSDDAAFVGNSRLEIIADNVTVRDLSFEGMCLPGYPYGAVSILNGRTAAAPVAPLIADIGEQRENVTISGISVSDTCNAGVQLVGENGLAGSAVSGNTFTNIGLKTARDHSGPADIVSVDEYGAMHGAIGLSFHPTGQAAVTDTLITGNVINGSSAAGIRVMKPDGVTMSHNNISNTADSAIGLAAAATNTTISDNIALNANNQPDFDYLDHIENSDSPSHYYKSWDDPGPRDDTVWWRLSPQPYDGTPAADAAIKVWAHNDTADITIRDNRIAGGSGGLVVCAGVCGVETDGFIQHGDRDIVDTTNDVTAAFTIRDNTMYESVGGVHVNYLAAGNLSAVGNTLPPSANLSGTGPVNASTSKAGVVGIVLADEEPPASGYRIGEMVGINITFNVPVDVVPAPGGELPYLVFSNGETATFAAGNGTAFITFDHTVALGKMPDYATAMLVLNGGKILNSADPVQEAGTQLPPAGSPELAKLPTVVFNTDVLSVRADPAISVAAGTLSLYFTSAINAAAMDLSDISVNGMSISGAVPPPRDTASPVITMLPSSVTDSLQGAASAQVAIQMAAVADHDTGATLLEDYGGTARIIQEYAVHASCDEPKDDCLYAIDGTMPLHDAAAVSLARANPNDGLMYVAGAGSLAVHDAANATNVDLASYDSPTIHDIQINEATNTAYVAITHGPTGSRTAALLQVDPVAPHAVTDSTPVNYTANATSGTRTDITPIRLAIDQNRDRAYLAVSAPPGGPVLSYDIASATPNAPSPAGDGYPAEARDAAALVVANSTVYAAAADGLHALAFSETTANYTVQQTISSAGAPMDMEAATGSLYVLSADGTLDSYSIEYDGSADATVLAHRSMMDERLFGWASGARSVPQIELDEANSRLYAASHAAVSVYNATGADEEKRLSVVPLPAGSQPQSLAISPDGSTALVVPSDAAHMLQIRPMPKSAIHTAIDATPSGGTVMLPAGTYDGIGAVILDRPMTVSGNGSVTLQGDSYVRSYAAGGALSISGIAFSGTACSQGNPAGSAVTISSGAASISGSTFENTCGDAVTVSASSSVDRLAVTGNTFRDIGIPADGSAPERRAAAVRTGDSHDSAGQLAAGTIASNLVFGTSYAGVQLAGATSVDVSGNYIEDTPGPAVLVYQTASDVTIRGNTIVRADSEPDMDYLAGVSGSNSTAFYDSGQPAEAAITVWAGADGIRATLNRIYESGSGGAFLVCEGACHAEADGSAASTAGGPHTITSAISFNHNMLHGGNSGIANLAGGMLNARNNFFPGHADAVSTYVNDRTKVDYVPAFNGTGPVKVGLLTQPSDAPYALDGEIASAAAYSVDAYNARQVAVGGLVSLELVRGTLPPGTPEEQRSAFSRIHKEIDDEASKPILRNAIDRSIEYHEAKGMQASLDRINALDSDVPHYPFAIGYYDAIVKANGADASLAGTFDVRVLTGGQAGVDMINETIAAEGEAWWEYSFTNPLTGEDQLKRSLLVRHGDLIYGAGYYAGDGPSYYVGPTTDAAAAALLPYATDNDLVLVSPTSISTVPPLAEAGDGLIRLAPNDAHMSQAISIHLVDGGALDSVFILQSDDPHSEKIIEQLEGILDTRSSAVVSKVTFAPGQDDSAWVTTMGSLSGQLVLDVNSDAQKVVFAGSAADFVSAALAAGEANRVALTRADWIVPSIGNHSAILSDDVVSKFAYDASVVSPTFGLDPAGSSLRTAVATATGSVRPSAGAYSAYDAVVLLGRGITTSGDVPLRAAADIPGLASVSPGALGTTVIDAKGDLSLPNSYELWRVTSEREWSLDLDAEPELVGPTYCGIMLERAGLDLGNLVPGRISSTAVQVVTNTGTTVLDRGISLTATDWMVTAAENSTLPYNLTEISEAPRSAPDSFNALVNMTDMTKVRTSIGAGLPPTDDLTVKFRLNLSTVPTLPTAELAQTVRYGVFC